MNLWGHNQGQQSGWRDQILFGHSYSGRDGTKHDVAGGLIHEKRQARMGSHQQEGRGEEPATAMPGPARRGPSSCELTLPQFIAEMC